MASCAWRLVPTNRMRPPCATVSLTACRARCSIGTDCVRSTMWMLLRVPKMYSDIFGFQRWAWWPKWTPASNSWRMLKSGSDMVILRLDRRGPMGATVMAEPPDGLLGQGPRVRLGALYRQPPSGRNRHVAAGQIPPLLAQIAPAMT